MPSLIDQDAPTRYHLGHHRLAQVPMSPPATTTHWIEPAATRSGHPDLSERGAAAVNRERRPQPLKGRRGGTGRGGSRVSRGCVDHRRVQQGDNDWPRSEHDRCQPACPVLRSGEGLPDRPRGRARCPPRGLSRDSRKTPPPPVSAARIASAPEEERHSGARPGHRFSNREREREGESLLCTNERRAWAHSLARDFPSQNGGP